MKQRYLHVTLEKDGFKGGCILSLEDAIEELRLHYSEAEPDDAVQLKIVEMTQEEYEGLPEFEGW